MIVAIKEATPENFQGYGSLVTLPDYPAPLGTDTIRYWPALAKYLIEGETEIGLCTCLERPRQVESLERHCNTPEILVPLDDDFILPVAYTPQPVTEGNKLKVEGVQIMKIRRGTVVILNPGVWHWAVWPDKNKSVTYLVEFKSNTPKEDFEKKDIEKTIQF